MRSTDVRPLWVLLLACAALAFSPTASGIDAEDKAWLERSRDIIRSMEGKPPPAWLQGSSSPTTAKPPSNDAAKGVNALHGARSALPAWAQPQPKDEVRERRMIFVSFSMPEPELLAAMDEAAMHDGVVIMRGLAKGESVTQAGQRLRKLAERLQRIPEVQLDPFAFRQAAIDSVPTIAVIHGDARLFASGSLALGALTKRFASGERGHLGQRGTIYPVVERDMMEEIQARIGSIDWKAQREGAYARYWSHRQALTLAVATVDRERAFDPSVEVKTDLHAQNGQLVARAGQRVNPQALMPLRSVWFVFDPSDRRQLTRVERELSQLRFSKTPYVLMATQLERGREWEHLKQIEDRFGLPINLATQELVDRFGIERIPVRIQGKGSQLAISELSVVSR